MNIEPQRETRWAFEFVATGPGAPTVCRVRRLLKAAKRAYGLRALIIPLPEKPIATPEPDGGEKK